MVAGSQMIVKYADLRYCRRVIKKAREDVRVNPVREENSCTFWLSERGGSLDLNFIRYVVYSGNWACIPKRISLLRLGSYVTRLGVVSVTSVRMGSKKVGSQTLVKHLWREGSA